MRAGPYIQAQIESAKGIAAHYRREAAIFRAKADEYERLADASDDEAARWAAGTDFVAVDHSTPLPGEMPSENK